ncbi:cytochrome c biogenesis CcdA family protein [Ilumatobacter nonamiensis]|uniref:cytochrome c biogenesis CcdA family protein n=1 Tax=Ilumatobacter nonamiensis TaxID=467093 RepID=UPI00034CF498|nr:cytochrome c biogenesis CcdA family protein [Ilumatobacter nonamiensis]
MIDAPLALAFTAGMIASINPCGFALLPAYVGAFVAGDDTTVRADRRILRAVGVSVAVSAGFAVMFIAVGIVFSSVSVALRRQMPWVTIAIGVIMLAMGVASIVGWKPRLPFQNRASLGRRDAVGMATFGFVYALVSLSCTLGPFLSVSAFAMQRSFLGGIVTYVVYAAGMGTIILALSVSAALAHESLVGTLGGAARYAPRLAGVLLVLSGGYAVWYGRYELAVYGGNLSGDSVVEVGTNLQTRFVQLTQAAGSTRIALAVLAITVVTYLALRLGQDRSGKLGRSSGNGQLRPLRTTDESADTSTASDRTPSRETSTTS